MSALYSSMPGKKLRKSLSSGKLRSSSSAPGKLESTISSAIIEKHSMISGEIESRLNRFNTNIDLIFSKDATDKIKNKFKKMVKKINREFDKVFPSCIFEQLGIDKALVLALIAVLYWEDEYILHIKGGNDTPSPDEVSPDAVVEREPRIPPHVFWFQDLISIGLGIVCVLILLSIWNNISNLGEKLKAFGLTTEIFNNGVEYNKSENVVDFIITWLKIVTGKAAEQIKNVAQSKLLSEISESVSEKQVRSASARCGVAMPSNANSIFENIASLPGLASFYTNPTGNMNCISSILSTEATLRFSQIYANSQMETTILTNQVSTIVTSSVFFGSAVAYLIWYIWRRYTFKYVHPINSSQRIKNGHSRQRIANNGGRQKTRKSKNTKN
jgi:hypothetical protein